MYKIETHLHTTYISHCGWLGAQAIMKAYSAAGYDAICVTDHYNRDTFDYIEMDLSTPGSKTRDFLLGYHRLKREGEKYGIRVYAGAELRFDGSPNDYLLYGFHDELLADPERVMSEGLEAFAPKYRADGALLIQAHPFRGKCTPAPAELLDGVEVLNLNPPRQPQRPGARLRQGAQPAHDGRLGLPPPRRRGHDRHPRRNPPRGQLRLRRPHPFGQVHAHSSGIRTKSHSSAFILFFLLSYLCRGTGRVACPSAPFCAKIPRPPFLLSGRRGSFVFTAVQPSFLIFSRIFLSRLSCGSNFENRSGRSFFVRRRLISRRHASIFA